MKERWWVWEMKLVGLWKNGGGFVKEHWWVLGNIFECVVGWFVNGSCWVWERIITLGLQMIVIF